ncbi:TIM23 complex component [Terramyces sp. JEL0728]|nr:TIM23 complex component [Terramyces sp. JEL0728]
MNRIFSPLLKPRPSIFRLTCAPITLKPIYSTRSFASGQNKNQMDWKTFFTLRKSRKRYELGTGVVTGFLGLNASSFYFLFIAKFDPTEMIWGIDPLFAYAIQMFIIGALSFVGGNLIATPLWRVLRSSQTLKEFDAMEKQFLNRLKKYRPTDLGSVGAGDNVGYLDYFGERIQSVKDYRPIIQTPAASQTQQPKVQPKKADISKYLTDEMVEAPKAEWTDNAEMRAEQLLQRKKYMLQQARLKMYFKS